MTQNDWAMFVKADYVLENAVLLGAAPEVEGARALLETSRKGLDAALQARAEAGKLLTSRLRQMRKEQARLSGVLRVVAEEISEARLGRLNAPFNRVGGPTLREINQAGVGNQLGLVRLGLDRIEALKPSPAVLGALGVCRQQCQRLEESWRSWSQAWHGRQSAQVGLREARKRLRQAYRALMRMTGAVTVMTWSWPRRKLVWPDPQCGAALLFGAAEGLIKHANDVERVERMNRYHAYMKEPLLALPPEPAEVLQVAARVAALKPAPIAPEAPMSAPVLRLV